MFERVGHLVEKIRRVRMGPLVLDLEPGRFRALTGKEVEQLKKAASGDKEKESEKDLTQRARRAQSTQRRAH
jgi:hypothetical protein